jgi:hypothetical protein
MEMNLVDFSFAAMESPERGLDFCLVVELKTHVSIEYLKEGASRAFAAYPKSAAKMKGYEWVPDDQSWPLSIVYSGNEMAMQKEMEDFVQESFRLNLERGIKQRLFQCEGRQFLITKMHHALADGLSILLWLKAQLTQSPVINYPLSLKTHPKAMKESLYKLSKTPDRFGHDSPEAISSRRRWSSLEFEIPQTSFKDLGISYNDFICTVIFKAMNEWFLERKKSDKNISLYIPVNIRENPFQGFGNGSSRIKIYDDYSELSYQKTAISIREQVNWCKKNGLWSLPSSLKTVGKLPLWLSRFLLKTYAAKPGIDMGSMVFSHVESYKGMEDLFALFKDVKGLAQLYKSYSAGMTAVSLNGKTILTTTWDSAQLTTADIEHFHESITNHWLNALSEMQGFTIIKRKGDATLPL